MLEIKNVSFRYANSSQWILRNFDFSATKGELIAVTGANGSGKTTLLNIIGGVIPKVIVGDFAGE
ncbi:MAG TPA: ATP-binding cassette domain-containing protein, partial [Candidatus Cloacimonadota bacterium]|nr:ATP-binding cassette domain-containing protein [Candidatus Cloacimonadota bacterium]